MIVCFIGDVNNGKTTLLSSISKKVFKESYGITQKIRSFELEYNKNNIIFIDTPGHDSFLKTIMKIIKISDVVTFVIDITKGISCYLSKIIRLVYISNKYVIFLLNKIDTLNDYDLNIKECEVKNNILRYGFIFEESGGNVLVRKISAFFNFGINNFIEDLCLIKLFIPKLKKANYGYVLGSKPSKYKKYKNKLILKNGKVSINDYLIFPYKSFKIREIFSNNNTSVKTAYSNNIFNIFSDNFIIGDKFKISKNNKNIIYKEKYNKLSIKSVKFKFAFKSDCYVKYEAFKEIYNKNFKDINIYFLDIGRIKPSDIKTAKFLGCNIIYFSEYKSILSNVITFDNIHKILLFLKNNNKHRKSEALVVKVFFVKKEYICGCKIIKGFFNLNDNVLIYRNGIRYNGTILSLMIKKKSVSFVKTNENCGILLKGFKPKISDIIKNNNE
ncbi:GTP-binding protein [Candidatus Vidania fulgoroideorum]